jgi:hypothetical protein
MGKLVLLDTGVLGFATNPKSLVSNPVAQWITRLLQGGHAVFVPGIADYELRRELIRIGSTNALARLNSLCASLGYISLNTETMHRAAELWAKSRAKGRPMAHEHALDGDVILCAQAQLLAEISPRDDLVVATTNVGHLRQFVSAEHWQKI